MAKKNLVIVESPAKAKTIEKILGKNYHVTASFGHVRDLPKSKLGVDIENNFKPSYMTIRGKGDIIKNLKDLAKKSDKVYLASDPDREGEAIAWHISNVLKLEETDANRIEFNEITDVAIREAIRVPRVIDINKVDAQQARRVLDRLVGYEISPLLWKSISSNTSAGRVQSVALKLICDLEDIIKAFISERYWDIKGTFQGNFNLALYKIENEKFERVTDYSIVEKILKCENKDFEIIKSKITKKSKNPPLPLKTSTLQQLASSYLGFPASKTMRVAQTLYEGLNIDGGHKGLITYMRTDSTRISEEAKTMAKSYIERIYGKEYIGEVKEAKNKGKIQDAHEGVRPTDVNLTPKDLKEYLDGDQFKLYKLIWERFIISQLAPLKYEQFELICEKEEFQFRGTLNKIIFDGYYKLFKDEEELPLGDFPHLTEGDNLLLQNLIIKEDYTKAPARLTESSLVKKLEQEGIGRPSTYAAIIDTLKKREYVEIQGKSFIPTELGYEIKEILEENFSDIMNVKFTADMENNLDSIEEGEKNWVDIIRTFYDKLAIDIEKYKIKVEEEASKLINSDVPCPCGDGYMVLKNGRFGRYLVCQDEEKCKEKISLKGINIPLEDIKNGAIKVKAEVEQQLKIKKGQMTDLIAENNKKLLLKFGRFGSYLESENFIEDNIRISLPTEIRKMLATGSIVEEDGIVHLKKEMDRIKAEEEAILSNAGVCEKCGKPFELKRGRWGRFLACTGYPTCKNIKKIDK